MLRYSDPLRATPEHTKSQYMDTNSSVTRSALDSFTASTVSTAVVTATSIKFDDIDAYSCSIASWVDSVPSIDQQENWTQDSFKEPAPPSALRGMKRPCALMESDSNASPPSKRLHGKRAGMAAAAAAATAVTAMPRRSERRGSPSKHSSSSTASPSRPLPPTQSSRPHSTPRPMPLATGIAPVGTMANPSQTRTHPQQLRDAPTWPPSYESKPPSQVDVDSIDRSTTSTGTATSRQRSRSPVKKKMDLTMCTHRVDYKAAPRTRKELPLDVQELWRDLFKVAQSGVGVLPHELQELPSFIADNADDEFGLSDFHFALPDESALSQPASSDEVLRGYLAVKDLLKNTRTCKMREKHEAAWNEEVHRPVLVQALGLEFEDTISVENITKATIDAAFVPTFSTSASGPPTALPKTFVQSKMVDYGLFWIPDPSGPVAAHISQFLGLRSNGGGGGRGDVGDAPVVNLERTINQTMYTAVRDRPAAVAIETKTPDNGGGTADGRDPYVQLGVWNLAWINRVRSLMGSSTREGNAGAANPSLISLPMLRVQGGEWHLSLLCDTKALPPLSTSGINTSAATTGVSPSAVIFDFPVSIGSTESTLECYKLLASLRRIGVWVVKDFAPWWEKYVGEAIAQRLYTSS